MIMMVIITIPISLEIDFVSDQRYRSIVAAEPLVFTDDVQISGSFVEAGSTHDRVDNDKRVRPLQVPLWFLVRLYTACRRNIHVMVSQKSYSYLFITL